MSPASALMAVEEALLRILADAVALAATEMVPLRACLGRTLAADLAARRTQPPLPVSAMDGYAVRSDDIQSVPAALTLIGESAAGRSYAGRLAAGQAVRIFTGAPLPEGADAVLIQENAEAEGDTVLALESVARGRHVRTAGQDFSQGEVCLRSGSRLTACDLALAAAMNHPELPVARKPRVAVLATGDELVLPGSTPGPGQITASNGFAVAALVETAGGEAIDLGIVADDLDALAASFAAAGRARADVLVTLGGASVGDRDLVQQALVREGMTLDFWRIAMRPGKPMMHGRLGTMQVLGLPGNPVSAIVCGLLFLVPLVRALSGDPLAGAERSEGAILGDGLPLNDGRQDYIRGRLVLDDKGFNVALPQRRQDSSLLKVLSDADCLILRRPHAPPSVAGDPCRIIRLAPFGA